MIKIGVLLHVYETGDAGWSHIAWGDPRSDKLGCLPKLCQLLLTEPSTAPIDTIAIFSGPTKKDGLSEGAYTKKFLIDSLPRLVEFPSLKPLIENNTIDMLRERFQGIVVGEELVRTADEIAAAAQRLRYPEFQYVIQIACASHAPRCVQQQTAAREQGIIPNNQLWSVVASDTFYIGSKPEDTVIFEKPHLSYDPMISFRPSAPEVLRKYFGLSAEEKQAFLSEAEESIEQNSASSSPNPVA